MKQLSSKRGDWAHLSAELDRKFRRAPSIRGTGRGLYGHQIGIYVVEYLVCENLFPGRHALREAPLVDCCPERRARIFAVAKLQSPEVDPSLALHGVDPMAMGARCIEDFPARTDAGQAYCAWRAFCRCGGNSGRCCFLWIWRIFGSEERYRLVIWQTIFCDQSSNFLFKTRQNRIDLIAEFF